MVILVFPPRFCHDIRYLGLHTIHRQQLREVKAWKGDFCATRNSTYPTRTSFLSVRVNSGRILFEREGAPPAGRGCAGLEEQTWTRML